MIDRIDHVVVNCRDVEAMAAWYERVLGFRREIFGPARLHYGIFKLQARRSRYRIARDGGRIAGAVLMRGRGSRQSSARGGSTPARSARWPLRSSSRCYSDRRRPRPAASRS